MNSKTPIVKRPENKKNRTPTFGIWNKEHIILNLIYNTLPNYEDYGN